MKALFASVSIAVGLLTGCASQQGVPIADSKTQTDYHATQVTEYFQSLSDPSLPGFAYLIAKDGKVIAQGGVGLADVKKGIANGTSTKFRAASITKQFTAISILQLAEKGLLSLDDPITMYFPGFPNGKKITIRHLLNHTSGIWEHQKD